MAEEQPTKKCTKCGIEKPLDKFSRRSDRPLGVISHCKECCAKWQREGRSKYRGQWRDWPQDKKERHMYWDRNARLKRKFGIDSARYHEILAEQGGKCAICDSSDPGSRRNKHFHVDHCHTTGVVRGLLCAHCNTAIGSMRDSPERLRAAVAYLERTMRAKAA